MALNITLPKDKAGQQKLILAVLPVIILAGYWFLQHGKKKLEATNLELRADSIEAKNNIAKTIALRGGPELAQKLALYEQHMKRLEELIPRSEEIAALLNGLTERAIDSNVDLSLMKPEPGEAGEFYTQQTYKMEVVGGFHDIGRYLAAIASGPRIVAPVELHLKPRPAGEQKNNEPPRLNADFRIITYVIPPAPDNTPAPVTPPANGQTPPPATGAANGAH